MKESLTHIKLNSSEFKNLGEYFENRLGKNPLIALCGGRSILKGLEPIESQIDLNKNSIFLNSSYILIDERLVPLCHEDSNFNLLNKSFFEKLRSHPENLSTLTPFRSETPDTSLQEYSEILKHHQLRLDLAILGVGEDGHIAALFPSLPWNNQDDFFTFNNSPKPPNARMSASPKTIYNSKNILLLFLGEGKKIAWERFLANSENEESCPCILTRKSENLIVITDFN